MRCADLPSFVAYFDPVGALHRREAAARRPEIGGLTPTELSGRD